MMLPWPHSQRVEVSGEVDGRADGGFVYASWDDVRPPHGALFEELTNTEQEDFAAASRTAVGGSWRLPISVPPPRHHPFCRATSGTASPGCSFAAAPTIS